MICSNCGAANQPGVNFCTRCGTRLVPPTAPQGALPPIVPPSTPATPPQYTPAQYPPQQYPPQYAQGPGYPTQQYPPGQYPVNPAPVKKGRSPCGCCFTVFLVLILLIIGTVVSGYFLLQNGTITQRGILNTLGMGTGEAAVLNLTDGDLSVDIVSLGDSSSDSTLLETNLSLKPTDSDSFTSIRPGRYRLTFTATVGGAASGTCSLQVGSGDVYQFVALNEGVVVTSEKYTPTTAADMNMATSSLCKK
ncbi:MAG TPA: zinc ribbon domain-containing protein [Chloroflexia bacterium]